MGDPPVPLAPPRPLPPVPLPRRSSRPCRWLRRDRSRRRYRGSGGRAAASACGTSAVRPSDLAARAAAGAHRASRARAAVPGPDASRASSSAAAATGPGGRSARALRPCSSLNRAPSEPPSAGWSSDGVPQETRDAAARLNNSRRSVFSFIPTIWREKPSMPARQIVPVLGKGPDASQPSPKRERRLSWPGLTASRPAVIGRGTRCAPGCRWRYRPTRSA